MTKLDISLSESNGKFTVMLGSSTLAVGDEKQETLVDAYNNVREAFLRGVDGSVWVQSESDLEGECDG